MGYVFALTKSSIKPQLWRTSRSMYRIMASSQNSYVKAKGGRLELHSSGIAKTFWEVTRSNVIMRSVKVPKDLCGTGTRMRVVSGVYDTGYMNHPAQIGDHWSELANQRLFVELRN